MAASESPCALVPVTPTTPAVRPLTPEYVECFQEAIEKALRWFWDGYRYRHPEDVAEVVQDIFLRLLEIERAGTFGAALKLARKVSVDKRAEFFRKKARRSKLGDGCYTRAEAGKPCPRAAEVVARHDAHRVLAVIPRRQREVVWATVVDEEPLEAVGERYGRSKWWAHRQLAEARRLMLAVGGEHKSRESAQRRPPARS